MQIIDLLSQIDDAIKFSDQEKGLRLILSNFSNLEGLYLSRLKERVAIILGSLGHRDGAAEVWGALSKDYANRGLPTRSIAAIKQMEPLNIETEQLVEYVTERYSTASSYLDHDAEPRLEPHEPEQVDFEPDSLDLEIDELVEIARNRALEDTEIQDEPGALPPIPVLSRLEPHLFKQVIRRLSYEMLGETTKLIHASGLHSAKRIYWTVSADFLLEDETTERSYRLPPATLVGGGRLLQTDEFDFEQGLSVTGMQGSEYLHLNTDYISQLRGTAQPLQLCLETFQREGIIDYYLQHHPLFSSMAPDEKAEVMSTFEGLYLKPDQVLIEQGSKSPGLFLLLSGEVSVDKTENGSTRQVATLGPGDVFGEIELVSDHSTTASCRVSKPGYALFVPADPTFQDMLLDIPNLSKFTVSLASDRLEQHQEEKTQ